MSGAWQIECTSWTPARGGGDRIAYVDLLVGGRLLLADCRLVQQPNGQIAVRAGHLHRVDGGANGRPRHAFSIVDWDDRKTFAAAAVEAVRRFDPAALPNNTPNPAKAASAPPGPAVGVAA